MRRQPVGPWMFASVAAILAFGVFVWPTPYRYDALTFHWTTAEGKVMTWQQLWRVNRFTGEAHEAAHPYPPGLPP